jgi:hypothetical protein
MAGGKGKTANGPGESVPTRFNVCGELAAFVETLTLAVRVPVALAAGLNVTLNSQKCVPSGQLVASTVNSEAFGPEITGAPVVIGSNAVALLAGVFTEAVCAALVVPGPWPVKVNVGGTNDAESSVPDEPASEIELGAFGSSLNMSITPLSVDVALLGW